MNGLRDCKDLCGFDAEPDSVAAVDGSRAPKVFDVSESTSIYNIK
jgi:hypothetical protein